MTNKNLENKNIINEYNLYWPVYQNIENQLLNMTNYIRFDDKQLKVYSDSFLELLIRICIEIESISKDLYLKNGGKVIEPESEMYFDTICLNFLENKWRLGEKIVQINNSNMFFSQEHTIFQPLKKACKRGTSGCKWKRDYQAIKHNRNKNYSKGNLENCIMSLAALYILNIYYKDETFNLHSYSEINSFDLSQGSKIFSIKTSEGHNLNGIMQNDKTATYFINYTDDFVKKAEQTNFELNKYFLEFVVNDSNYIDYINKNSVTLQELAKDININGFEKIINIIGKDNYVKYMSLAVQKSKIHNLLSNSKYNAYLNKRND